MSTTLLLFVLVALKLPEFSTFLLDVLVTRLQYGRLGYSVSPKLIHTDRYLQTFSRYHVS